MDITLVSVTNKTTEGTNINCKTLLYVYNTLKQLLIECLFYKTLLTLRQKQFLYYEMYCAQLAYEME